MKAQETTLKAMLEGQKQYVVPLYQRRYGWSQPEWKPLWGAILREYAELQTGDDDRGHFLGSLVVQQMPVMAHGVQRFSMIDGQQRLATTFIVLAVLRDSVEDAQLKEQIQKIYLTNPYAEGEFLSKIRLGDQDQTDIDRLVAGDPDLVSGKVGAAYWWFRNEFDLLETREGVDTPRLVQAVTSRMEVVDIAADDRDNAYRIFQTLNSTGKRLTAVDLLRNHFFMLLPTRADDAYLRHWAPMEALLDTNFATFLWVELVARGRGKETVPTAGVYAAWQADLEAITGNEGAVFKALERLHSRALLYDSVLHPDHLESRESAPDLNAALARLNRWGAPVQNPVVLHLLQRWQSKESSSEETVRCLNWVEAFLVRRMLARIPTNNLNRIFTTVVGQLAEESVALDTRLREILSGPGKYWPSDADVLAAVLVEPFYWTQRGAQRQYVLRTLEESIAAPYRPDWDACNFTIEHVMPQSLSPWWFEHLATSGEDPATIHSNLLHTIGNITLTCENNELGNLSFEDKKPFLRADILRMNKTIVRQSRWSRKQIQDRSKKLGDLAVSIWPGPLPLADTAEPQWELMIASLAQLPEGSWTSYDDLAELASTTATAVRDRFISMTDLPPRAEAVLLADGRIDGDRPDVVKNVAGYRQLLVSQGVLDDVRAAGAPVGQRFYPQQFSQLLGEE